MTLFPIFLALSGRSCLVVGGGRVGLDRALRLVRAGAGVTVVEPSPSPALAALASSGGLASLEPRTWSDADTDGRFLVLACTDDAAVNNAVADAATRRGILFCRADEGEGDFSLAATLERGDLCVAVSSSGASPVLAQAARDRIAGLIGEEYGEAAAKLADLRRRLREGVADARLRREALARVLADGLLDLLREGRRLEADALVERVGTEAILRAASPAEGGLPCTR